MSQIIKNNLEKLKAQASKPERMVIIMKWVPDHMRPYIGDDSGAFLLLEDPTLEGDKLVVTNSTDVHDLHDKLWKEAQNATPDIETPDSTND